MPYYVWKITKRLNNGLAADYVADGRDECASEPEARARAVQRWGDADWVIVEADDWQLSWMKITQISEGLSSTELRELRDRSPIPLICE
jgi:hypothetical protein